MRNQNAGLAVALLTRPGNVQLPVPGLSQPNVVAHDMPALAARMIALWRP
jgi:2-haloacid dehalogenase